MTRKEYYENQLGLSDDWADYLLRNSNLPGPGPNMDLMEVFVEMGSENDFLPLLDNTPEIAPAGTPEEFLAFCGTAGLGELVAGGLKEFIPDLRTQASDPRSRIRQAVVFGLQMIASHNPALFNEICTEWEEGNPHEREIINKVLKEII